MTARQTSGTRPDLEILKLSDATVDESIEAMARRKMGDVVTIADGTRMMVGAPNARTAADYLVARLFTDAVFDQDIRAIQLIINRIDGGLPKDVEVENYRTEFGDCLNEIMSMTDSRQAELSPDDTVMMCLCKSLYQIATADIYWDYEKHRKRRPSDSVKKERDAALRMVLERTGGRKTMSVVPVETENVEIANWISELPKLTC